MGKLRYNKFLIEKLRELDNILNNCGCQLTQIKNNLYTNCSNIFDCVQDYTNKGFNTSFLFSRNEDKIYRLTEDEAYTLFDEACFYFDKYFEKLIEEIYKFSGRIFYYQEELK